jgi:N-acylneuraminate cytidylyltransferase
MIAGRSVLAVIAARGGSKGLPGKNLCLLAGKPLLHWSVAAARGSAHIDRIVLSTDDDAIAEAGRTAGCEVPFRRPAELATDEASIYDVLKHAASSLSERYQLIVLLQATSPLRQTEDIDGSLRLLVTSGADSVVSVTPAPKPPHWMYRLDGNGQLAPLLQEGGMARRQEAPPVYVVNGAVYAAAPEWVFGSMNFVGEQTVGYVMPPERSVDVDTMADLLAAEHFLKVGNQNRET